MHKVFLALIFAVSAGAQIKAVAALHLEGPRENVAILVLPGSPIHTVADLRGKQRDDFRYFCRERIACLVRMARDLRGQCRRGGGMDPVWHLPYQLRAAGERGESFCDWQAVPAR